MFQDKIEKLLRPIVESLGYEWWGSEYISKGKNSLLRVYIAHDSGIRIEDCERTSREIGASLDVEETISGHYFLEVSSPGIPRPLFYLNQYMRYVEHLIEIKLHQPLLGQRKFIGKLQGVEEPFITLEVPSQKKDTPPASMQFSFSNIMKASVLSE
jgi:ribosome maturation factor RimP